MPRLLDYQTKPRNPYSSHSCSLVGSLGETAVVTHIHLSSAGVYSNANGHVQPSMVLPTSTNHLQLLALGDKLVDMCRRS